jgi:hypothetical protein
VYYWNFGEDQQTDSTTTEDFTRTYIAYDTDSVYITTLVAVSEKGCRDTNDSNYYSLWNPKDRV